MPATVAPNTPNNRDSPEESEPPPSCCYLFLFWLILLVDLAVTVVLLSPIIPWTRKIGGETDHYTLYGSLIDLAAVGVGRVLLAAVALTIATCLKPRSKYPFPLIHPNGDSKSNEELEQEALEESFGPWFTRYLCRPSFPAEIVAVATQVFCIVKCLLRMNMEIGDLADSEPLHPIYWVSILLTTMCAVVEACYLDNACQLVSRRGERRNNGSSNNNNNRRRNTILRTISSSLSIPLLNEQDNSHDEENDNSPDEERPEDVRGVSDISADAAYKAKWNDLWGLIIPDLHLIALAFVFLLLAALAQILVPRYLGKILDALSHAFANQEDNQNMPMSEVPGFIKYSTLLVVASVLAGIFSGLRGSIFTVVGGRVNVRLRIQLMDALLSQDIGFFDTTKTGEITSRLSSDTTLVGDQVTLNVNVFLRSFVQACGVLFFMWSVSWQLTILAFISVPLITLLSKWYGGYVRSLTKLMQKKLADGNSVSEAALGSMPTVRAFDAAESELKEFETHMGSYLGLNYRSAVAYCGYAMFTTSVPQLVFAVVVFYGGMLVRNKDMTSGDLVGFLFYLQSLSDAFSSIGYIFSSLTQAIGAADKVFELMHREPRYTPTPHQNRRSGNGGGSANRGLLGMHAVKTRQQRTRGLEIRSPRGEIQLQDVDLYYPARPQRQVLNKLNLNIEAGSIVALVGQSGGGKSSVMSLVQHLYEPSAGSVTLDGKSVNEIRPQCLSRTISIVSQEPTLFARSIKRNIIYGLEGTENEPTDEEVYEAARLANADDFIQAMPQKYDTDVGERGVQLSGGQKQRIAIARALIRKPKVLLLDEATSALDANSELAVQKAIDDMIARGKHGEGSAAMTVLIVAHRLSTVRNADKIFVVQDGQVVEQGSHSELLRDPAGAYTCLISGQMQAQKALEESHKDGLPLSPKSPSRRKVAEPKTPAQVACLERIRQEKKRRGKRSPPLNSPRTSAANANNGLSSPAGSVSSRGSYASSTQSSQARSSGKPKKKPDSTW